MHLKKHETVTDNPSIRIYVNKIEKRITFKVKTGYCLELLTPKKMNLLHLETIEVILANYYIVSKNCQHNLNVLHTFIPNKSFGQLLDISLKHFIFLKTFNSELSEFRIIQNILVYGLLIKILNHQK